MSTVRLIRAVPHMREQHWGRIVTVASSSIKQPIENLLLSNTYRGHPHGQEPGHRASPPTAS